MHSTNESIVEPKIATKNMPGSHPATEETKTYRLACLSRYTAEMRTFQDTQRVVSVIHHADVGLPTVVNHTLHDNVKSLQIIPVALSYQYISTLSISELATVECRLLKSLKKGISSLQKVCQLVQDTDQRDISFPCTKRTQQNPADGFPRVVIEEGAFISNFKRPDGSEMKEIYTKIQFQYSNGVTSSQHFQTLCGTAKPVLLKDPRFVRYQDFYISTGLCLFSKLVRSISPGNEQSTVDDDSPTIPTLPQGASLTLYELEIITRLSSATVDVVGLVKNISISCDALIKIHIDIPDFQYYWTACKLFDRRLVSLTYVQSWISAIDERRKQLAQVMESLIRSMLTDRHLSDRKIVIETKTGVAGILIKELLALGKVASLQEIISALRSRGDDAPQWREFLDHLDSQSQPSTEMELGQLTYVFNVVKPALGRSTNTEDMSRQRLLLQVDDTTEWKIHKRANVFLKTYSKKREDYKDQQPFVVGLFDMQKIFIAGPGRSDLYHDGPGSRLCLSPGRNLIGPLDVIGETYGLHIRERLKLFMLQSGLEVDV